MGVMKRIATARMFEEQQLEFPWEATDRPEAARDAMAEANRELAEVAAEASGWEIIPPDEPGSEYSWG